MAESDVIEKLLVEDNAHRLILLDLKSPKVEGPRVLEKVKADSRTRAIPMIIVTSSKEERDMVSGYKLGVNSRPPAAAFRMA